MTYSGEWHKPEKIKRVTNGKTHFDVLLESSIGFGFSKEYDVTPKVGDSIQFYNRGGMEILGLRLNGKTIFQKSDEEYEEDREEFNRQHKIQLMSEFNKNKDKLEAQFADLPPEFKARIERLRSKKDNYRWEFEPYDLFISSEAVTIAKHFKGKKKQFMEFAQLDSDKQSKVIPTLKYEEHSGNTFGMALTLAGLYLDQPKLLKFSHGGLVGLVGCEGYGCHPLTKEEDAEANALIKGIQKNE